MGRAVLFLFVAVPGEMLLDTPPDDAREDSEHAGDEQAQGEIGQLDARSCFRWNPAPGAIIAERHACYRRSMHVYLVPVGSARYELYCEVVPETPVILDAAPRGTWQRIVERFRTVLAAVEHEEERRERDAPADRTAAQGFGARLRRGVVRWLAERIAEQRLLWHLGRIDRVSAAYPEDITAEAARTLIRAMLNRDRDRHRFWLVINAVAFIGSGLLMPIPGPNLVAYYFAFRLVGHFLSMRGAQNGLSGIEWALEANAPLASLRSAATLAPRERDERVRDVAAGLGLLGLQKFYRRIAVSGA
jgi:hypothetical protein